MATIDEMLDAADNFAEAWIPSKAGDQIGGNVISRSSRDGGFGEYVILVIDQEKGDPRAVHCAGTALKAKVQETNPQPGDYVAIRYVGEAVGKKSGNTYKDFRLVVKKTTITEALDATDKPF